MTNRTIPHRGTALRRRFLAATACLGLAFPGIARAQSASYDVNQVIGGGTVTGQIVTDGKTGSLAASNITAFNLILTGNGATYTLTNANSGVFIFGGATVASTQNITFNYAATDGSYLLFETSFGGGQHYLCFNTSWYGCKQGASIVPQSYSDSSAIYAGQSGTQTIAVATVAVPIDSIGNSFIILRNTRTGQMIVYNTQTKVLLGKNEQVSCGNCGGAYITLGSLAFSSHGRVALTDELTVLGGFTIGQGDHRDAQTTSSAGVAIAFRYDPSAMGATRPYAEIGGSFSYQRTSYTRRYATSSSMMGSTDRTTGHTYSGYARAGLVSRLSLYDELAVSAGVTRVWQGVGGYTEATSDTNIFAASMPAGTDQTTIADLSLQYTRAVGRVLGIPVELNLNGGINRSFAGKSGVNAQVANLAFTPGQPSFTFHELGGRIGLRLQRWATLDAFVNTTLAPKSIGSSTHGGVGLRINF